MNCLVLIFSKDRALQLDATLRSYLLHCRDAKSFQTRVLYTTSSPLHAGQYEALTREYGRYDFIRFLPEQDFRSDVLALLAPFDSVLFLVDDNMFVRDFRLEEADESLRDNPDALGASLRLGRNTTYCYTLDKTQGPPEFQALGNTLLKYPWPAAEYDFGYPLELSGSAYRTEDMLPYLAGLQFQNPNTLEGAMSIQRNIFRKEKPFLLCFDRSVVFSIPLNMVQTMWKNRTGGKSEHSPDSLANLFAQGRRIDVHAYSGFSPEACHQEVELKFVGPAKTAADKMQPLISVIIPCYKQAQYLPEAVGSVVNQTYKNWECIIVNDGSPDNTGDVARELIGRYPGCDIRLLEKPNSGLADARNTGIRDAKGAWILPLDSDDMFAADYMERAVEIIRKNPSVNLVTTNEEAFGATPHEWIPNEYTPQRILRENTFIYASVYKKELWEAAGSYYPGIPWGAEDWNFWIACSGVGIVQKRIPEKLFLYRTHAGTSMRDIMKKHWSEVVAMIHTLHPGLYPAGRLLEDHALIASAHPDTVAKIDAIISQFPDLSMPYFWRGLVHERRGNPDLAHMNYEKSLALSGKDNWQQELRLLQGKAHSSVARLRDALPAGEHLLPASGIRAFLDDPRVPEEARKSFAQADEYFLKNDLVQARNSIAQALRKFPNNPCLMIAHGTILLRMEYVEAARKEFLRAKILDPVTTIGNLGTDALMTLGECYAGMGDYKNAVSLFTRVMETCAKQESADRIRSLRVGIPVIGSKMWSGGVTYIELLLKALSILPGQERPKVFFVVPEDKLNELDLHTHLLPLADGVIFAGRNMALANTIIPKPFTHCASYQELFSEIDFYYPVPSNAWPDLCSASWIPDFQHVHLPEFFSPNELQARNSNFQKIALFAKLLVLSSKDAEKDFRTAYPHSKAAVRILSFHTLMPDEVYAADPTAVQNKYNLPDKFLICSNQFWAHKNHLLLFEALAELKRAGKPVHLVCTGSTSDYRSPDYFAGVRQKLSDLGLNAFVHILGIIPRNEQLQLMRRAAAVVQPSLFEGWSTVVEDARALGKDMILSDLPVHKEQEPQYAVYFERNSRGDLAQKISHCFFTLKPGPDLSREEEARRKGTELVREYALQFCSIALEAQSLYENRAGTQSVLPGDQPRDEAGPAEPSEAAQQNIRVSAVVSTYNSEKFIRGCLEDLVNQTLYKNGGLEIIVVNSGSQQNEETVIKEFQSRYPHIRHIRTEERETVYAAWNRGIREAKGEYITNANTDDRHREDALGKMAELMDEHPDIGLVYADVIVTETENQTFGTHTPVDTLRQPDFSREILSLGCFAGPQPMWRRSLHERYGFFDETFVVSGDWEFWLRIAQDTKFLHIPECLGLYFRSPSGLEHRNRDRKHRENNLIVKKYLPGYWPTFERDLLTAPGILNSDGDSVYKIGHLLITLERPEAARSLFSEYLKRNPDDFRIRKALDDLAAAERTAGRTTGTEHAASVQQTADTSGITPPGDAPEVDRTDALKSEERVMALLHQADSHIARNDLPAALEAVREALPFAQDNKSLRDVLTDILINLSDPESAREFLDKLKKSR